MIRRPAKASACAQHARIPGALADYFAAAFGGCDNRGFPGCIRRRDKRHAIAEGSCLPGHLRHRAKPLRRICSGYELRDHRQWRRRSLSGSTRAKAIEGEAVSHGYGSFPERGSRPGGLSPVPAGYRKASRPSGFRKDRRRIETCARKVSERVNAKMNDG